MEEETNMKTFDMDSLLTNLPQRRGLSKYYSGMSRTFICLSDVRCLEDLKKKEHPDSKKTKKYSKRKEIAPNPRQRLPGSTQLSTPCVGA